MLLTLIATMWSVFVARVYYKIHTYPPLPRGFIKVTRLVGRILLIKTNGHSQEGSTEHDHNVQTKTEKSNEVMLQLKDNDSRVEEESKQGASSLVEHKEKDWQLLVEVLDRVLFVCFMVTILSVLIHVLIKTYSM